MNEPSASVNGVEGRFFNVVEQYGYIILNQKWVSTCRDDGIEMLKVEMRFDDQCRNNHESFAITATIYDERGRDVGGGCCHDGIARVFPELAPLIKWHLMSVDGPMHYLANTLYHASNRDHYGLLKGEKQQIRNRAGFPSWILEGRRTEYAYGDVPPEGEYVVKWEPRMREGEGKERDLDAARSAAVWPEATDEQLCLPRYELEELLKARLPALLADFKADMIAAGFVWPERLA